MENDTRPTWKHSISEDDVRWLSGIITKITHHWRMTSADTSEDWIELHREKDKRRFPTRYLNGLVGETSYFQFAPSHASLVQPTSNGRQAINDLAAIDAWEKKHKRERAEYERLRAKFNAA